MNVPLMVGVGGAIYVFVLASNPRPGWTRRSGTEWVFRVMQDLSRVKRLGVLPGFLSTWCCAKRCGGRVIKFVNVGLTYPNLVHACATSTCISPSRSSCLSSARPAAARAAC